MSRECGELRMRIEKSEGELQRASNSMRQESGRIKSILSDIWKMLDSVSPSLETDKLNVSKSQGESISSELLRLQRRLDFLVERIVAAEKTSVSKGMLPPPTAMKDV